MPSGTTPPPLGNPAAQVGLTAVNGSATTAMRSDAAPALSQAITPTWTGQHTFNNFNPIKITNGSNSGYIAPSASQDGVIFSGGAYWNGSTWIATATSAFDLIVQSPNVVIQGGSGLTVGNAASLTNRALLTLAGGWQAQGTTTNDTPPAGYIGEVIESQIAYGANIALTNNTPLNVTSITLPPGDWDVSGNVFFTGAATTTVSVLTTSISTQSATLQYAPTSRYSMSGYPNTTLFQYTATMSMNVGPTRFSVASNTTIYLVVNTVFATSTCTATGAHLYARRRR
jgi:hypothetical protein